MNIRSLFAGLLSACLALPALPSFAQVAVDFTFMENKAIMYEPIIARLSLKNNFGNPIRFGASPTDARLIFDIQTTGGDYIFPHSKDPLLTGVDINPNETREMEIEIGRLFPLQRLGRFKAQAIVEWRGAAYGSKPRILEIANGVELMRIKASVPNSEDELRAYILKTMPKDDGTELYLLIEDEAGGRICGLVNLGCFIRSPDPSMRVDEVGNLHVLFRAIGGSFVHSSFTPFGVRLFSDPISPGPGGKAELVNMPNGDVGIKTIQLKPEKFDTPEQPERSKYDWMFPSRN